MNVPYVLKVLVTLLLIVVLSLTGLLLTLSASARSLLRSPLVSSSPGAKGSCADACLDRVVDPPPVSVILTLYKLPVESAAKKNGLPGHCDAPKSNAI